MKKYLIGTILTCLFMASSVFAVDLSPGAIPYVGSDGKLKSIPSKINYSPATSQLNLDNAPYLAGRGAFQICGDVTTVNNNTVYYGPNKTLAATTFTGLTCDLAAAGNVTEATVDEPIFKSQAFQVTAMICRQSGDANADVSYTLRTAAGATVPSVTCTIADNDTDCVANIKTTTAIAANATVAIAVASAGNIGTLTFVCDVFIQF